MCRLSKRLGVISSPPTLRELNVSVSDVSVHNGGVVCVCQAVPVEGASSKPFQFSATQAVWRSVVSWSGKWCMAVGGATWFGVT